MLVKVHLKEFSNKTHEIEIIQNNFNTKLSAKYVENNKTFNVNTKKIRT